MAKNKKQNNIDDNKTIKNSKKNKDSKSKKDSKSFDKKSEASNKKNNSSKKYNSEKKSAKNSVNKNPVKKSPAKKNVKPVKIIPLGGLGEIGKNITLYEYDGDMFLVDCGMTFPDEETPGIDITTGKGGR